MFGNWMLTEMGWTREDAVKVGTEWEKKYSKETSLAEVFDYYQEQAQDGKMLVQQQMKSSKGLKDEFNKIPIKWMEESNEIPIEWMEREQGEIDLCAALRPRLCGNLESRGILKDKLVNSSVRRDTPHGRISYCEKVLKKQCSAAFGQIYEIYRDWSSELCGDPTTLWDPRKRIIVTEYRLPASYDDGSDAIVKSTYRFFLLLVLCIWWMSMIQELRHIIDWIALLCLTGSSAPEGEEGKAVKELTETEKDDEITILAVPLSHKLYTLVFHILPRTYICLNLSHVGTKFLIGADDYNNLILNSVALGFLIELDEMLYAAVVGSTDKTVLSKTKPLEVKAEWLRVFRYQRAVLPVAITLLVALIVIPSFYVSDAFYGKEGKHAIGHALSCLCQVEGEDCVSAMILGGKSILADVHEHLI
eukprot:TRINITY_DN8676_c0_g1_i3.p1 TRINITY_DN8676_c0_g1~~TRINITY_DN8676_c0_g1_i3.p1  ORF type:complete len:418 (+),score=57.25 TRINITY_DN8676_c0_g1_i3:230-1483(+)